MEAVLAQVDKSCEIETIETMKKEGRNVWIPFLEKKWRRLGDNWRILNEFSNIKFGGSNKF